MHIERDRSGDIGFDPAVLVTIENVIAPGRRSRLSPFVEAAQFEVLFGKPPDEAKRVSSAKRILEDHKERLKQIAASWRNFSSMGKPFAEIDQYQDRDFLDAYLAYYFSVNVPKVQLALLDLLRAGRLSGALHLLDVGVGTGTTAVATLDFLLALGNACDLHGVTFPISSLQIHGIDRVDQCTEYASSVVTAYARAIQRRIETRTRLSSGDLKTHLEGDIFDQVHTWALATTWDRLDLTRSSPMFTVSPNLVVVSNALNELRDESPEALGHLEACLERLDDGAIAVIIEPGEPVKATGLTTWRRKFVNRGSGYQSLGPCGQEFGSELPEACEGCWLLRRERFHQGPLYAAFRDAIDAAQTFRFDYDEYENRLLSWSYTLLEKTRGAKRPAATASLRPGDAVKGPLTLRYIGTYLASGEPVDPASNKSTTVERVKFCPATVGVPEVQLRRDEHIQLPWLQFGQECEVRHVRVAAGRDGDGLELSGTTETFIEPLKIGPQPLRYLGRPYDERSRRAVDEFAYRLFGFPKLHEFQHVIIGEVLQGNSILGIAATGGGKSECFILPAILMPGVTVVVSPLKALMADQFEQRIRDRYGLAAVTTILNGDVTFPERQGRLDRLERGYYKLIYVTPEQLEQEWILAGLRRTDSRVGITYLALDEAHCISQWGHDFRPAYLNISRRLKDWKIEPTRIALTATASPYVRQDICSELELSPENYPEGNVYVHSSNRPELNLVVRTTPSNTEKSAGIVHELKALWDRNRAHKENGEQPEAAIVFMPWAGKKVGRDGLQPDGTSPRVMPFALYLQEQLNQRVTVYHGQMDNDDEQSVADEDSTLDPFAMSNRTRQTEQVAFIEDRCPIMVATKGFGMGVDKPNIRRVIHRTLPGSLEAYAQEAGRAGRDGEAATDILYYADAGPPVSKGADVSDKGIQDWFREGKYIRREDVQLIHAFLQSRLYDGVRSQDWLYFTNDEVFQFAEQCEQDPPRAGLARPFEWPEFLRPECYFGPDVAFDPTRKHHLFDKGRLYRDRSDDLERILDALYSIRPGIGGSNHISFFEQMHKTGTTLEEVTTCNAKAILNSNFYFGRTLREALTDISELNDLLRGGELQLIADRLSHARGSVTPVYTMARLAHDIMSANGSPDANTVKRDLLKFKRIAVPHRGVAFASEDHESWVLHAGAWRSASRDQAHAQAKKAMARGFHRELYKPDKYSGLIPEPILSDHLHPNRPSGWEVRVGTAFERQHLAQYIDAFMELHDRRKNNDRESFKMFLTSYVGAKEDGALDPEGAKRRCLRRTMLGYLKSYEVIQSVEGNSSCLSCSVCVPDEHFEPDIEKRRQMVVRVGERAEAALDAVESCADVEPASTQVSALLGAIEEETRRGRSLVEYVNGWSIQLLEASNGTHRGALWIRLCCMADGQLTLQPEEFVDIARRILVSVTTEALPFLWSIITDVQEGLADSPSFWKTRAELAGRMAEWVQCTDSWEHVLALSHGSSETEVAQRREAHEHLSCLFDPRIGSLPDPERFRNHRLEFAHHESSPRAVVDAYRSVAPELSWHDAVTELDWISNQPLLKGVDEALLAMWLDCFGDSYQSDDPSQSDLDEMLEVCTETLPGSVHEVLVTWPLKRLRGQPTNRGALWLRAMQLAARVVPWSETHFFKAVAGLLSERISEVSLCFLRDWILTANTQIEDRPEALFLLADCARRLKDANAEALALEKYLLTGDAQGVAYRLIRHAFERLSALYAADGPIPNSIGHQKAVVGAARLQETTGMAADAYRQLVADWDIPRVEEEIAFLTGEQNSASLIGLLVAMAEQRHIKMPKEFAPATLHLFEMADMADARALLIRVGALPFRDLPQLADRLADHILSDADATEDDLFLGVELFCWVVLAGLPRDRANRALLRTMKREAKRPDVLLRALRALGSHGLRSPKLPEEVYKILGPLHGESWAEWFLTFPAKEIVTKNRELAETIVSDIRVNGYCDSINEDWPNFVVSQVVLIESELRAASSAGLSNQSAS